jgi:hypothetical protein
MQHRNSGRNSTTTTTTKPFIPKQVGVGWQEQYNTDKKDFGYSAQSFRCILDSATRYINQFHMKGTIWESNLRNIFLRERETFLLARTKHVWSLVENRTIHFAASLDQHTVFMNFTSDSSKRPSC